MSFKQFLLENVARTNALKKQQELIDENYDDIKIVKHPDGVYEIESHGVFWFCLPSGEVLSTPRSIFAYATTAKKPFRHGEKVIALDPVFSIEYTRLFIKDRFPEAEAAILATNDAEYCYDYANAIGDFFTAGESIIAHNAYYALQYAENFYCGPWREGEQAISEEGEHALDYAIHIIKGRWPPGEEAILQDDRFAAEYANYLGMKVDELR